MKIEDLVRNEILKVLAEVRGNRTQAAKVLGLCVKTITTKISLYKSQGYVVPESEWRPQKGRRTHPYQEGVPV